jgi:4-diphosphocytidyl-2-C-methyl-D-erythritol kinase
MNEISVKAPAKLNLHLQVIAKRNDGFHDLRTLFTFINLYDQLTFEESEEEIELKELEPISDNLVLKAADLLKKRTNCNKGVKISLRKQIPLQKGLGGGSSDAAATLLALNKLWNLKLTQAELLDMSLELGSDVPFFIFGHSAWAEGRGEILSKVDFYEKWHLLYMPEAEISTKKAFEGLSSKFSRPYTYEEYSSSGGFNSFEKWARNSYKEIDETFTKLKSIGKPQLSGTGSSIFVSFSKLEEAESAKQEFSDCVLVKSLERSPLMQIIE